jgi:hypothetical protein
MKTALKLMFVGGGGFAGMGDGAGSYAPYPAPAGTRWEFRTENGQRLTENGVPQIELRVAV